MILLLVLVLFCSDAFCQTRLHVRASNPFPGDGTTWAKAFREVQDALDVAVGAPGPYDIWIAEGTYTPTLKLGGGEPKKETFQMQEDVDLYGGFAGWEDALEERNVAENPTALGPRTQPTATRARQAGASAQMAFGGRPGADLPHRRPRLHAAPQAARWCTAAGRPAAPGRQPRQPRPGRA